MTTDPAAPPDADDLARYLGVAGRADVAALVSDAFDGAVAIIDKLLESAYRVVPPALVYRAYLEVGANLYRRRDEQAGGSGQLAVLEGGSPVRAPRDPLASVRPFLNPYVVWM